MADLTLSAASPLNASDDSRLFFNLDADETQTRALDDVPANFLSMVSLNWAVEYAQAGRVDDTLILDIRIMNGATVLAAADSGGTFVTVNSNVTNTTEITTGPTAFAYVNTGASLATWNGASVELRQTHNSSMASDDCRIFVDFVEFTGVYAGSIQIDHTTDLNVGFFVTHTTDMNVSEFQVPTATNRSLSATGGTKMLIDANGTVWMVGIATGSTPQTIRLWEGPADGPGFWQLHEFNHGSGLIRDVAIAMIDTTIHVVYINHTSSTIRGYHIEWDTIGQSWTNNGAFGVSESHSDPLASVNSCLDITATSDDELVVGIVLFTFVSYGVPSGSTYRARKRIYRSTSQALPTSGGILHREWYGADSFTRPTIDTPALWSHGTNAYISDWNAYSRISSSGVESERQPNLWPQYQYLMRAGTINTYPIIFRNDPLVINDRVYDAIDLSASITFGGHVGYVSAEVNSDVLILDESKFVGHAEVVTPSVFLDHYGRIGIFGSSTTDDTLTIWTTNGLGDYFADEYEDTFTVAGAFQRNYVANRTVDRSLSVWAYATSGDWTYWGYTIPTWYIAHTTDVVIGESQVYHTTDLFIANRIWGLSENVPSFQGTPIANWDTYNSNYYRVTHSGDISITIWLWESSSLNEPGTVITTWTLNDIASYNGLEEFESYDWVLDATNGIAHFVIAVFDSNHFEYLHSEYDIDGDSWTHHGAFHASGTVDNAGINNVYVTQRADGDLICFFRINDASLSNLWYWSVNSGSGFATGTAITDDAGALGSENSLAVDGNDTHFIQHQGSSFNNQLIHWHLSSTNTLGSKQTVTDMLSDPDFAGNSKVLVHNGTMYVANLGGAGGQPAGIIVASAATGADAPTWTSTQVTTKNVSARFHGFVHGLNGVPTFVYLEDGTWKIWRAWLDGGSWVEEDTGQVLDLLDGDINTQPTPDSLGIAYGDPPLHVYPTADSNGFVWLWWQRSKYPINDEYTDINWYLKAININRSVIHTTDLITVEGSQVVVHATDLIVKLVATRTHNTDLVVSELAQAAVSHSTDVRKVGRTDIVHTTDAYLVVLRSHTTDLVISAAAHDLSATITLEFDLNVTLEAGEKPPATGLGIPRQGKQGPRIYNPDHRVVKR